MGKDDDGARVLPRLWIVQLRWHTPRTRGIEPLQMYAVDLIGAGWAVIAGSLGLGLARSPVPLEGREKARDGEQKQRPSRVARAPTCVHLAVLSPCSVTYWPS